MAKKTRAPIPAPSENSSAPGESTPETPPPPSDPAPDQPAEPSPDPSAVPPSDERSGEGEAGPSRQRIARLRDKQRKGKATPEELAEIAAYDRSKDGRGRKPDPTPGSPGVKLPPPPKAEGKQKTPPPPPHVGQEDWRKQYGSASVGREATCTTLATYSCGILSVWADNLKEADITPIFDPADKEFVNIAVLAWDEILPPTVEVAPRTIFIAGACALGAQRAIASKKINEARKRKAKAAGMPMIDVGASRMDAPPPPEDKQNEPRPAPPDKPPPSNGKPPAEIDPRTGLPKGYRG